MKKQEVAQILRNKGLKSTQLRLALLQHFSEAKRAFSYADLKTALKSSSDKSTLYRNLTTFEKAGLIHSVHDDSGVSKYAFGSSPNLRNQHPHFICEDCQKAFCLKELSKDHFEIPKGFIPKTVQTIIHGVCAECS